MYKFGLFGSKHLTRDLFNAAIGIIMPFNLSISVSIEKYFFLCKKIF